MAGRGENEILMRLVKRLWQTSATGRMEYHNMAISLINIIAGHIYGAASQILRALRHQK